jgi:cation:H+ antiporter
MEIFLTVLFFIIGLVLIIKGGDWFVDAASWIATVSGIPKFLIGATVVSLATTLPELLVSVFAAFDGKVDMAVGNAVGSVTANTGMIMAISVICIPAIVERSKFAFKAILLIISAFALWAFSFILELRIIPSILILIIFAIFIAENIIDGKKSILGENNPDDDSKKRQKPTGKEIAINIAKFIFGIAGIVIGADLMVDKGSDIARMFNVSEAIIGVTVIAIGTSLPELVTTITAIAKKESDISIGNILGANIIDLTLIMPLCAILSGKSLPIAKQSAYLDLPVCLGVVLLGTVPTLISGKFKRWQGIVMLTFYVAYLVISCTNVFGF